MHDLSLKGVARQYGNLTGNISVVGDIFGMNTIVGSESLRSKLESMARKGHSFKKKECRYKWTAAFDQTWTHIEVRIRLNFSANINVATWNALQTTWANGIHNVWTHRWRCGRAGELPCRLSFVVIWVNNNQHHTVTVNPSPGQTVMTTWHSADGGGTAAHEFGHMLGLVDEYSSAICPNRAPVNTGTVMDNNSNNVPDRLMTRFANNIGSNVVAM